MICDRAKGGRWRKAWAMFDAAILRKSYLLPGCWIELYLSKRVHSQIVLATNCYGRTKLANIAGSDSAIAFGCVLCPAPDDQLRLSLLQEGRMPI